MAASAALKMYQDIIGAARLKSKYPFMEYDPSEEDDYDHESDTYYHYRLTNKEYDAIPKGKHVSVVRLEGLMMRDNSWCQPGTRQLANYLLAADKDPRVIASILLTDSGGGAADSVQPLADAILKCKKPVLAFCDGDMCSAAYYVAVYSGYIMAAEKRNRVGCIGTMIQFGDYPASSKDEDGYVRLRIYADGSEEKNGEYERALEGDFKPIRENILNPLAEDFRTAVAERRPDSTEDQRKGRTYYAQDTVGTLIDGMGDFEEAVRKAIQLSNTNITTMKGYEHLQSIDSCKDLESVDGEVTLNEGQIADIDQRIAEGDQMREAGAQLAESQGKVATMTKERDDQAALVTEKETEITRLNKENGDLRESVAAKDRRISELEALIEHDGEDDDDLMQAMHNGNHSKDPEDWHEPTDEEAEAYCRKVLNGEI